MSENPSFSVYSFLKLLQSYNFQEVPNDTVTDDYFCIKYNPNKDIVSYEHPIIHLPIQLRESMSSLSNVDIFKVFYKVLPFLEYMDAYLSTEKAIPSEAQAASWNLYDKAIKNFYVLKNLAFFIGKEHPIKRNEFEITSPTNWKFVDSIYIVETEYLIKNILYYHIISSIDTGDVSISGLTDSEYIGIPMCPMDDFRVDPSFIEYFYEQLIQEKGKFRWYSNNLESWEIPILLEMHIIIKHLLKINGSEKIGTNILKNNKITELLYNSLSSGLTDFIETSTLKEQPAFKYPIPFGNVIDFIDTLPKNDYLFPVQICYELYYRLFGFINPPITN